MKQGKGCVYLVGAGPGAAELITLRGYKLLQRAECVVYDRLVSEELLKEVPDSCECIYVGKKNHHHTLKQEDINALLVDKALQYNTVIRLKGGDPYVFGRGGEEALYLLEHGISFEVVPGVTSAVAAPAYAGIPITHRGVSGGFHVVTAHNRRDELADIDFDALAKGKETCIFLMGLSKLGEIADHLMDAGMPPAQRVAVISHGTMPEQQCVVGSLENIEQKTGERGITSPAIIVVGDVVKLHERLNAALKKKYLLPKIGQGETELAKILRGQGVPVDELQVGEIRYKGCDRDLSILKEADWFVFTSRHGIEGLIRLSGLDIFKGKKIAVIGESTARYLKRHRLKIDLIPEKYTSAALAEKLKRNVSPEERVLYFRAEQVSSNWKKALQGCCQFNECVVYENCEVVFELPRALEDYAGIIFTCASSVRRFMDCILQEQEKNARKLNRNIIYGMDEKIFYSIGEKTTEALRKYEIGRIHQAEQANYLALAEQIVREAQ